MAGVSGWKKNPGAFAKKVGGGFCLAIPVLIFVQPVIVLNGSFIWDSEKDRKKNLPKIGSARI